MAVIAMSFDLMQEEIIVKCTWLGKKIGVIDSEPVNEEHITNQVYRNWNAIRIDFPNENAFENGMKTHKTRSSAAANRVFSSEPLQKTEKKQ